ncbi:aquaporin [Klebsormidium nitens]|uniref:Aquaporin n=1 Tax=Klebsormidium nitens TaxID=105231 RepID=A0A1Y1HU13_KLENI|nr:aquaporin [Klebsormidium nitens]|eukprot:GAQ80027.1 aquaporin [Klebsormidium nitens]
MASSGMHVATGDSVLSVRNFPASSLPANTVSAPPPAGGHHVDLESGFTVKEAHGVHAGAATDHETLQAVGIRRHTFLSKVWQPRALSTPMLWRDVFVEFLSTGLFIFFVISAIVFTNFTFAGGVGLFGIAFAFGITIFVLVYSSAGLSGGHINPAVTFAMFLAGRIDVIKGLLYMCAQVVGAICGAAIVREINTPLYNRVYGGCNFVQSGYTVGGAFSAEVIGTFVLIYTIFAATDPKRSALEVSPHLGVLAPLAIGFSIFVVHIALIPVDGVSINPARSFGPAVVLNDSHIWKDMWIFWVGPLTGAILATFVYEAVIRGGAVKGMQRYIQ